MEIIELLNQWLIDVDCTLTAWIARHGALLLRMSIGIVFLWFGALKLVPGLSPAEGLIRASLRFLPLNVFIPFLGLWEIAIGLGFITGKFMRPTILLMHLVFTEFPFGLTLAGEIILKNLVLISAALVVGATMRGSGLVHEPQVLDQGRGHRLVSGAPLESGSGLHGST